jgi:hypothetical protein
MSRLRAHLSYANVIATLALFCALGGVGYAAARLPRNSVGTKQIKKGAVSAAKIRAGAVTAAKIRDGAVTGAKVSVSTLATVPSAAKAEEASRAASAAFATAAGRAESAASAVEARHADSADSASEATHAQSATTAGDAERLGGLAAGAFVQGGGSWRSGRVLLQLGGGGRQPILAVPGWGELEGGCGSGGPGVGFKNGSGAPLRVIAVAGTEADAETVADGADGALHPSGLGSAGLTVLQIGDPGYAEERLLTVLVTREAQSGGRCGVQAWAMG